jgi:signal transduction histidine kinase
VLGGLAAFVVATYVVVVLGGGALVGRTDSPDLALSVLATAVVALGVEPVQRRLDDLAAQLVGGGTPSPYDLLSRFSETVTGAYATEELPARLARLLGQGTSAQWAQVWLTVQGRLRLAATWPPEAEVVTEPPEPVADAEDASAPGRRAVPVRHGGQVFGVFRLQELPERPLTSVEERLFTGLAAQAGLVLRNLGLQADLAARHDQLAARAEELRASRLRLAETQDAERRRLERDIHDGAQQHLVALAVNLRLAETVAVRSPGRAAHLLLQQSDAAQQAIETVSRLSRGIHPRLLTEQGLVPALRAAVATSAVPVLVHDDTATAVRRPASLEAAFYFCALEAVQNATKHAGASQIDVTVTDDGRSWRLSVADDGRGLDPATADAGTGLTGMRDRLEAVGARLRVSSLPGRGTTVVAELATGDAGGQGRVPLARLAVP